MTEAKELEVLKTFLPHTLRAMAERLGNESFTAEAYNFRGMADKIESGDYAAVMEKYLKPGSV